MPPVTLTPEQRNQVLARVRAKARERRAPARHYTVGRSRLSTIVGGAAALVVVVLIGLGLAALLHQQARQQPGVGERTPAATGASSPLDGTEWLLTSLNGAAPLEGTHVTLTFDTDQLGGFAGCNAYGGGPDSGAYSATPDGELAVGMLAVTAMDCPSPEGVLDQETAYVDALQSATTYQITGDRLELADASGQTVLVYTRQPGFQGNPADLPGTTWQLVSLDGQSPIGSRPITLAFKLAGEATGYAGCRDYRVTYEATGGDLSFISTEMIGEVCTDQALLQQEGEYTTVLGWTRHYRLAPGQLELFTARGETLTFLALPTGGQGDVPTPAPTVVNPPAGSDLGKLAWIQDGDVWIRVLPDGGPVRLTDDGRNSGRNSEPRWSASGEWLAYRKDTQVWLVRATGQDAYAVDGGGVIDAFAWSPVGGDDRLAYVAGSGMLRLDVLRAGETEPLSLLPPSSEGQPGRIAWRPDGTSIAYEWRRALEYEGLWQVPSDGGEPVELYDSGLPERGEALLAGWRADGDYLLFWQGDVNSASLLADGVPFYALPVADSQAPTAGGQPKLLAGGNDVVLYYDDAWSTSRGVGYVALTVGGGRETWTNKRIAAANPNIVEDLVIATEGTVAAASPVFSPGGAQLVYAAAPAAAGVSGGDAARAALSQRHIWVIGDESSTPRQLTHDPAYRDERPRWSADGSHLLFVRMDQQDQVSLWLLPGREDSARQVADGLGPLPGEGPAWFGNYGHVEWDALYDWWQAPIETAPPINQELGPGPFLSEAEVLALVGERDGQDVEVLDAALLSEASARQQADACNTFTGHPDGVWLLTVRGTYEGAVRTLNLFLDAITGEQLCGEEISLSGEGERLARLRVTNDSPYHLDRVVVIFSDERIAFGSLAAGETSTYRAVRRGVYGYAAYNVVVDGQTIDQPVVDWVGEQPLDGESFTYVLSIDPERPFMQQIQGEVHEDQPGEASSGSICAQPGSGQPASRLVVEEHPLVGPPGSPEETEDWFHTADGPTDEILAAHQIYRDSAALLMAEDNRLLEAFGYRLELAQCGGAFGATYRLYRDSQVSHSGISAFSLASVNASSTDFVMQLEMAYRPNTFTGDTLEPNGMRAAYLGDELVTVQVSETLAVRLGGQQVYDAPIGGNELAWLVPVQDRQTSHALESPWTYDGRWAIEWGEATPDNPFPTSGHVVVDGQDLNGACGYDESFNFTLLDGRPFYFFEQDGMVNLAYDGQVIPASYDTIPHYRCCSGAVVNPGVSPNMVWFFATRGDQWYYVEAYVPLDEMPESTTCPAP
jgi:heat shock protein HslJ/Tol biopolymer transport system component